MAQISIIQKTDITEAGRFDAEYFKPEYLKVFENFKKGSYSKLSNFAKISDGDHAKFPENQKNEVRYLRAKDIKNNFLENTDPIFVSQSYFEKQKRSHITGLNILMSIMGSIGDITITPENFVTCLANRAVCIIKDISINPYFLFAYLTTSIADKNIQRIKKGGIQERINLEVLGEILIPVLSQTFQLKIERIVKEAHQKQTESKRLYQEAEQILLTELDLVDFQPKHELTFSTTKKEIQQAQRFDSEYFQPKYFDIINKIEGYSGGFDYVKNIFNFNKKNFFPNDNDFYNYVPLSKVSKSGEITIVSKELGKELPTRARRLVKEGEIILSSISGSLETSAIIAKEHHNFIVSNGFYVFSSKKINSETLLILFKSEIMLEILQRISKGAILGGYDLTAFEKVKIPLIKQSIQIKVANKITLSHKLRLESKALLELAKTTVEQAIENSETI